MKQDYIYTAATGYGWYVEQHIDLDHAQQAALPGFTAALYTTTAQIPDKYAPFKLLRFPVEEVTA